MKVSVNEILGSARRINSQRDFEEESRENKKQEVKSDTITISSRINSRLDKIETELRDIQSSLTKNQIIRNGIGELKADFVKGGINQDKILDEFTFEGKTILRAFMGESITSNVLETRFERINELINRDITGLKKLQVEVDNIMASNLTGPEKAMSIMSNIDSVFSEIDTQNLDSISRLSADSVRKLIK